MLISKPSLHLLALPAVTTAVSLSDFKPYATDLPEACDTVYKSSIDCEPEDFTGNTGCSQACVKALQLLVPKVKKACGSEDIGQGNIIYQFISGSGPESLCQNADTILGGGTSASSSIARTTVAVSSSKRRPSTIASSTEVPGSSESVISSVAILSGTATATSLATTSETASPSGGLLVDTGSASSTQTSTATATATSYGGQSNDNPSNGGSPFDTQPGMSGATARSLTTTTLFIISASIFTTMLR